MTLERFAEWVEENVEPSRYANVSDLIDAVEAHVNADGFEMHEKVKQLLLDKFASHYDPQLRALEERMQEQMEIARFLGNGTIPVSMSDEIIMSLQRPEIMGIDFSDIVTTKETVVPPEIKILRPTLINRFGRFFTQKAKGYL